MATIRVVHARLVGGVGYFSFPFGRRRGAVPSRLFSVDTMTEQMTKHTKAIRETVQLFLISVDCFFFSPFDFVHVKTIRKMDANVVVVVVVWLLSWCLNLNFYFWGGVLFF